MTLGREPRSGPRISWRAGGWILLLSLLLSSGVVLWRVRGMLAGGSESATGDGHDPRTYGFTLSPLLVDADLLAGSGMPRDGLPVLDHPPLYNIDQVDSLGARRRGKYLVSSDRVIGVVLRGHARAYPLNVLNWHEIVNDTLGGRAITVTYSPLADAAVVFGRDDSTLFGHSGLLYNSNLLLYDRAPGGESLWSQLQARAVAGPAAEEGATLEIVASNVVHWSEWRRLHPGTTVLARDPARADRYRRDPYISYYGSDILRYPVRPLPPPGMEYKTRCIIVGIGGERTIYPFPRIVAHADSASVWRTVQSGVPLTFFYDAAFPPTARVAVEGDALEGDALERDAEVPDLEVIHAFWFAWFAMHPEEARRRQAMIVR